MGTFAVNMTHDVVQITWTLPIEDETAQLELDPPVDRQRMCIIGGQMVEH